MTAQSRITFVREIATSAAYFFHRPDYALLDRDLLVPLTAQAVPQLLSHLASAPFDDPAQISAALQRAAAALQISPAALLRICRAGATASKVACISPAGRGAV